jgi:hypothetical protein
MLQEVPTGRDQKGPRKFPDERFDDGLRVAALPLDTTIGSLVVELDESDAFRRIFAARRLGWFGPTAAQAVPALIESLKNNSLRQDGCVLQRLHSQRSKPSLLTPAPLRIRRFCTALLKISRDILFANLQVLYL